MQMIETTGWDYKEFIEENRFYVDKTLLIEEVLEKVGKVVLITRPRRFGKTLNLSMLEHYFDIKQNNEHLFKGKKIENVAVYRKHLNKYPVIFLTLKEVKGNSFEEIYSSLKVVIRKLYLSHDYILKSDNLSTVDKKLFNQFLEKEADIGEYKESLSTLSYYLYKHYNKKVIILLDEYDSIVNSLKEDLYNSVISLLRGIIGSAFKGNDYLEKGIITGILRIAKEELFSGANNIVVRTILTDDFSDKFGFTEEEVNNTLIKFNLTEKAKEIKDWYNGYSFGKNKITIYNPFSIANYLLEKDLKNYWINTGSNSIIKNLLLNSSSEIKKNLDSLLKQENINVTIKENVLMSNLKNRDYLWSLLLFSGYLKPIKETDYNKYDLSLVNNEVISSMNELIEEYFIETMEMDKILKAIKEFDIETFGEELTEILLTNVNNIDLINENSYHTFLLGLSVILRKYYIVKSNEGSGRGRYDISIESRDQTHGYIIEIKSTKNDKEELKKLSEKALEQIEKNVYYADLKLREIKTIYIIGIAFRKKDFIISNRTIF